MIIIYNSNPMSQRKGWYRAVRRKLNKYRVVSKSWPSTTLQRCEEAG